jgi:tetratricopeptide (TPR) repeat protein
MGAAPGAGPHPAGAGGGERGLPAGLWAALAAGLAARAWYFSDLARQVWYGFPVVDSLTFDRLALGILQGDGQGAFFRPPLYPYFLAAVYALFGHRPGPVAWLQFLLGLAALVPAYLLGRRWFGPRAALAGAWIGALYPLRIFLEGELLDVTLFTFLFLCGLWLFQEGWEVVSPRLLFWSGLLCGAAALTRPNLVLAFPFILAGASLAFRRPPGAVLRLAAAWAAGGALAIAPATVHNAVAEGALIPVAANGGVNFYLGNEPGATGLTPVPPGLRWQSLMQEGARLGLAGSAAQERYWWGRARAGILAEPGRWLRVLGVKALLFANAAEASNNKALDHFTAVSPAVRHYRGWYGALVCLAGVGLVARRREPGARFLAWTLGGFAFSVFVFFVAERYRVPVVPLLAVAAGAALVEAARAARERQWRSLARLAAGSLALAALVFPDPWGAGVERIDARFQMAQIHLMRGEPAAAARYLEQALAAGPADPDVLNSLGAARFQLKDYAGAEESYRAALRLGDFSEVWFNLGVVAEARGPEHRAAARDAYRRALAINPGDGRARANLAYLETQPGPDR